MDNLCERHRKTMCTMMASYIEAQLAERLACVAKPMRYSSSTMMCDSINERIVAMAITREARSHRAENQTRMTPATPLSEGQRHRTHYNAQGR